MENFLEIYDQARAGDLQCYDVYGHVGKIDSESEGRIFSLTLLL